MHLIIWKEFWRIQSPFALEKHGRDLEILQMLEAHSLLQRMEETKQNGEKKEKRGISYRLIILLIEIE